MYLYYQQGDENEEADDILFYAEDLIPYWYVFYDQRDDFVQVSDQPSDCLRAFESLIGKYPQ